MKNNIASLALAFGLLAALTPAVAQDFPSRPVRWVVPAPPGSNNDIFARTVGQELAKRLGQPVVIDNRPGAGSVIAADNVAKSPPDGYSILMTPSSIAISETMYKKLPYSLKDFTGVAMLAVQPLVIVVNPASGIVTLKDLIARAKAEPGKLTYASGGNGTPQHLATEMFRTLAGVDVVHVPYRGSAGAVTDLLGKRIDLMIEPSASVMGHIQSGALTALAVTTSTRSPLIPNIPTAEEAGLPGYVLRAWYGVLAPAATPTPIVEKLGAEINKVLAMPEVAATFAKLGATVTPGTPREFDAYMRSEIEVWGKLVKGANVSID